MPDRFLNLTGGTALIVTDLHGDRPAFNRCVTHFRTLHRRGAVQRVIFLGDLIHGYCPPDQDDSLNIILDVIALREEFGPDSVLMLLGNHEMPHIYGASLAKGDLEFTPRFEHALGSHRAQVLAFFEELPFYIRTAAGVMLSHAGPSLDSIFRAAALRAFDHRAILDEADAILSQSDDLAALYQQVRATTGIPYEELAWRFLAIQGSQDPRYPHLLRSFMISRQEPLFQVLWDALFTQNEFGVPGPIYLNGTQQFLAAYSVDAPAAQRVIVSGHIVTPEGGFRVVNAHHLRVSSAAHARPRQSGAYLLLDCANPVETAQDLLSGLRPVFDQF